MVGSMAFQVDRPLTGVTITGGTLTITDANGGTDGLSGIQLVRIS